jgi:hypothetical protein
MRYQLLLSVSAFLALTILSCKKQGEEGLKSLILIEDSHNMQICPSGGIVVKSGIDKNKNNILDSNEVTDKKFVCNGQNGQNGTSDKQIILPINFSANTTSTTPVTGAGLIKFSKDNYVGVDSIILAANSYVADVSNTAIVELYNVTDKQVVPNSTIRSSNLYNPDAYVQTSNVYNALPNKEITLGISLKSEKEGMFAASGSCYLILYRR